MHTRPAARLCAVLLAAVAASAGCNQFRSGDADKGPTPSAKPWLTETSFQKTGKETPEQNAVVRILEADRDAYRAGFLTLQPDSKPSATAKMIEEYVAKMEQVDTAGCPRTFLAIRNAHARAWQKLMEAIKRHPDEAYEGIEFMDAMHALFEGNEAAGRSLGGDVVESVNRVKKTYQDQFEQAAKYGIETVPD